MKWEQRIFAHTDTVMFEHLPAVIKIIHVVLCLQLFHFSLVPHNLDTAVSSSHLGL